MKFNDLHYDMLCGIFRHYVSDTMDGPFLLTLVCTKWRDLVVSTPQLWSYITTDESSSDYEVKLDVALSLSADFPLTISLVLPLRTIKPFKDPLLRASSLWIHLDNIVDAKGPVKTLWDGDEAMEMVITLLKEADIWYEGHVTWYYNQTPISLSTFRIYDKVHLKRDPTGELDIYFRGSYPIFHTSFSTSQRYSFYDTTNVFRHLKTMINLRSLHLSCTSLTRSYQAVPSTITFPLLNELLIGNPASSGTVAAVSSKVWTLLEELVQWISAPALEHIGITAPVYSSLQMIHSIYTKNLPFSLALNIRPQAERYKWEAVRDGLHSLRQINIEMSDSIMTDDLVLNQLKQAILQHVSPNAICTIIVDSPTLATSRTHPLNVLQGLSCPLNVTYKGTYEYSFQNPTENTINALTFQKSGSPYPYVDFRLPRCRKLRYTPDLASDSMHPLNTWPADLEELDSSSCSFRDSSLQTASSTFSRLTTVTCTPQVALVLMDRGLPSILQILTLVSTRSVDLNQSGFEAVVDALQKRLSDGHAFGSNLAQLSVQYFPPWFRCLKLLHLIVQRREQAVLSIKLPGLPHKSILSSLVSVLSGIPPVTDEEAYKQLVPEAYRCSSSVLPLNCGNCYNSGFECYPLPNQESCRRFINGVKVSITKDTISF